MYSFSEKQDLLTPAIKNAVIAATKAIQQQCGGAKVILYGSAARGENDMYSDIDLLILTPTQIDRIQRDKIWDVLYDISLSRDVILSSFIESLENWQTRRYEILPLYQNIQREGIIIV